MSMFVCNTAAEALLGGTACTCVCVCACVCVHVCACVCVCKYVHICLQYCSTKYKTKHTLEEASDNK